MVKSWLLKPKIMKKISILLFLVMFTIKLQANNDGFILKKWTLSCKIWGIIKYNAPNSELNAENKIEWNKQFISDFEAIDNTQNFQELNQILDKWILLSGNFKANRIPELPENDIDNIDMNWLNSDTILSLKTRTYLKQVRYRKNKKQNQYFHFSDLSLPNLSASKIENVDFSKKSNQILGLFEYWNFVEYFFAYKHLMSKKWENVLMNNISIFLENKNKEQFYGTIAKMSHYLEDGHAWVVPIEVNKFNSDTLCFPFLIKHIKSRSIIVFVDTTHNKTVYIGDEILSIDGKKISFLKDSILQYISYANIETGTSNAINRILFFQKNDFHEVAVLRGKDTLYIRIRTIERNKINYGNSLYYKFLTKDIGYLNLSLLSNEQIQKAMKEFENTKGIVINIRNYPKEHFIDFIGYFTKNYQINYAVSKINQEKLVGYFKKNKQNKEKLTKQPYYKGKIVILVNETTQSKAEFYAMFLKYYSNAYVIGKKTSGSNGTMLSYTLLGTLRVTFTGAWIGNIDGSQFQKIGIIPDLEVENTPNEQVNAAIKYLNDLK